MKSKKSHNPQLVTPQHIQNILHTDKSYIINTYMKWTGINELNEIYALLEKYEASDYLDGFFKEMHIDLEINSLLEEFPKDEPVIVIANHPFGGVDGLALLKYLLSQRSDAKLMANFLLKMIPKLSHYFLGVNSIDQYKSAASSVGGVREAIQHLKEGKVMGVFPAGQVSTYPKGFNKVTDREWIPSVMKLIRNAEVKVIPIFFHGQNSRSFHMWGKLNPLIRTALLPKEMMKLKNTSVKLTIGKAIEIKAQQECASLNEYTQFLRQSVYDLETK